MVGLSCQHDFGFIKSVIDFVSAVIFIFTMMIKGQIEIVVSRNLDLYLCCHLAHWSLWILVLKTKRSFLIKIVNQNIVILDILTLKCVHRHVSENNLSGCSKVTLLCKISLCQIVHARWILNDSYFFKRLAYKKWTVGFGWFSQKLVLIFLKSI